MTKLTLDEALAKLDPTKPEQWTAAGVPTMEILIEWTGAGDGELTRKMVTAHNPKLTRESLLLERANNPPPQKNDLPKEEEPVDETPLQISSTTSPAELAQMISTASLPQIAGAVVSLKARKRGLVSQKAELDAKLDSTDKCLSLALQTEIDRTPKQTFSEGVRGVLDTAREQRLAEERRKTEALKILGIKPENRNAFVAALADKPDPLSKRKRSKIQPNKAF